MHPNQMELWRAEPHPTPRIYSQLTPEQQARLALHLAFLMLKGIRQQNTPPPLSTPVKTYER